MCGYGGFGGGHMIPFFFMLIIVFGAMYFFKRGSFSPNKTELNKDTALSEEISALRREIEMLKQEKKEQRDKDL